MFAGTVREHKGLLELADIVRNLRRDDIKLCILGDIPDHKLEMQIRKRADNSLILVPGQPLQKLPKYLMASDVVCLLQREDNEICRYQLPAKVIDALAMGIPILATETPPLRDLIEIGAVLPVTLASLPEKLIYALEHREKLRDEQLARRTYFESTFNYETIARKMKAFILEKVKKPQDLDPSALKFEAILGNSRKQNTCQCVQTKHAAKTAAAIDIVLFWRQFDAGVYGRRADMLAKYLSRHEHVRQVLFVDPPLHSDKFFELGRCRQSITEDYLVHSEIVSRRLGLRDQTNLKFHTFIYTSLEERKRYLDSIQHFFNRFGVDPSKAVFWLFPVNEWLPKIVRRFEPKLVISDIVDDNRRQPGLQQQQINERDAHYREILGMSDLTVTNATHLMESMQEHTSDIRLLPNAFEQEPLSGWKHSLDRLLAIPSPRLGYVGNLESKIDGELLEFIARERPDWHIILVGSTHSRPEILELNRFPNVHFMGVLKYEEARAWMKHFDVAIIPHLDTPLTRSMNPLKAYVYIGAGLPVVATNIMNLPDMNGMISVATSRQDFVHKVEIALQRPKEKSSEISEILHTHTWEARSDQVMAWIREQELSPENS
ncbi:MAG: glycosyltransferase [Alphaproteobacteria bacterium]